MSAEKHWDGRERRRTSSDDHDLLTEISVTVKNNSLVMESMIMSINKRLDGHDESFKWTNRILYGAIGAFVAAEFYVNVIMRALR